MNMNNRTNEEALSMLSHMMIHHKLWFNNVIREIICQVPTHHHECSLESGIVELDKLHHELHQNADKFLHSIKHSLECGIDYDNFITAFDQFNNEIYALRKELEATMDVQTKPSITATLITMLPILQEQQSFAKRQLQTCQISLISIDLLNKIQEEYGLFIKEKILINIAQLLVEKLRVYDKVFCYDHETFLISLQNINATQALELVDRLRIKISKTPLNVGLLEPIYVTVSCGITALNPAFTIEQCLEQANIALYLAKKSGRNNTKSWNK